MAPPKRLPDDDHLLDLIWDEFFDGRTNDEIKEYLQIEHDIKLGMTKLKSLLREANLYRASKSNLTEQEILELVQEDVAFTGNQTGGYRAVARSILYHRGIFVKYHDVRLALKYLNPQAVEVRKGRKLKRSVYYAAGPDHQWCFDGHDKFCKFGLAIHGCVDAWSGKIIWLKVFDTNHDPRVVAKYYLQAVKERGAFPYSTRSDCGTETVLAADLQAALHTFYENGIVSSEAHKFVTSTRNTKIESLWSRFLKARGRTLIQLLNEGFEGVQYDFDPSFSLDRLCYLYYAMPYTQAVLDTYAGTVNTTNRRKNKYSILPTVAPSVCYRNPAKYNGLSSATPVDTTLVEDLMQHYCSDFTLEQYLPDDFLNSVRDLYLPVDEVNHVNFWDSVIFLRDSLLSYYTQEEGRQ